MVEVKARLFEICEEKKRLEFEIDFFIQKAKETTQKLEMSTLEELQKSSQDLKIFASKLIELSQKYQALETEEQNLRRFLR